GTLFQLFKTFRIQSSISNLDEIRNLVNNLPKENKEELKNKGFDINNEQHLRDFAKEIYIKLQSENRNHELSVNELDSIAGGLHVDLSPQDILATR
ncbi:hypothetical protein IB656_03115, partial [Francisella noatunensis]|nr:hypothetical protein [Francisella noatunensis]